MKVVRNENVSFYKYKSHLLIKKMLSPFCGMNQEIGYVSRTNSDMRLMVGSAALTGIHVLFDRPNPGRGAYHIGGTGILPEESMIRILGETAERYAQLISNYTFSNKLKYATYNELIAGGDSVLTLDNLSLFSPMQLERTGFPFVEVSPRHKLSWIRMQSCCGGSLYVPAQVVLVGYDIRKNDGEPWVTSAVTTGTAAHVNKQLAFKSALLELIQLDSVMGHWYSNWKAYEIVFDNRIAALTSLINRYTTSGKERYQFYYIPNPDLLGFTIACVYIQDNGLPKVVVGLGADLKLENAMYKAFLETVASVGLARMVVFKGKFRIDNHRDNINPDDLYDLDRNVEYYGSGKKFNRISDRFLNMSKIKASDLPSDTLGSIEFQLNKLADSFIRSSKQLYYLNLSSIEAKELEFDVIRVWSPDTLSLCLPSAPQVKHKRFTDYGGVAHEDPHPYP